MAAKKITLESLAAQVAKGFAEARKEIKDLTDTVGVIVKHMATKDDLSDLKHELKGDIVRVQEQVNSIETQIRGMRHDKLETRVSNLEAEVFGKSRSR